MNAVGYVPSRLVTTGKSGGVHFAPKNPYQLHVQSSNSEDVISIPLEMTFFSHKLNKSRSFSNTSRFLLSFSKSTSRLCCLVGSPTGLPLYVTWTLYTDMEFLYLDWYWEWRYSSAKFLNGRLSNRTLLRGLMLKVEFSVVFNIWILPESLTMRYLRYLLYWLMCVIPGVLVQ